MSKTQKKKSKVKTIHEENVIKNYCLYSNYYSFTQKDANPLDLAMLISKLFSDVEQI